MQLLLKQVKIIDPTSAHHGQTKDVLIRNGVIQSIRNSISEDVRTLKWKGACISPGWVDIGAFVGDPGLEHIETLESLCQTAMLGGFTRVAVLPNTEPSLQSKSEIEYIIRRSEKEIVDVLPIGAMTTHCKGEHLAEMIDMHHAGAIAFSDGMRPTQDPGLLLRALEYVSQFDGMIINHPYTKGLKPKGLVHEGEVSVSLGLQGIPSIAETMMVKRDIEILRYSESKLHIQNISCRESLDLIRQAKDEGLNLTASVASLNLAYTSSKVQDFDVNFKVLPPLRTEEDRQALIEGVVDGTIDAISSNHRPVDLERKALEFAYADFGISNLQTSFHAALIGLGENKMQGLIRGLSTGPRSILGLAPATIEKNNEAEITIFHPDMEQVISPNKFASKSKNNPFLNEKLPGTVLGIVTGKHVSVFTK